MSTETRYNFDEIINRRGTSCAKWDMHDDDVTPMWVADMDFASPPAVLERLHERVDHGVFGYTMPPQALRDTIVERMKTRYDWTISPDDLVFMPGLVLGLNRVTQTVGKPGDGILMQTPVYGPFLKIPPNNGRFAQMVDLTRVDDDAHTFHYENDYVAFEAAISAQSSMFYLCNPHNPAGKAYTRDELQQLADICLRHDVLICSDEIHCDLLVDESAQHIPIASLSPEIANNTITLMAPSKTFNLAGLACSFAIVPNETLRTQLSENIYGMGIMVNLLGYESALAAYQHGDDWLQQALAYMRENRDILLAFMREELPMLKTTVPEATYLAWVDCSALPLPDDQLTADYFLEEARVALNAGTFFSPYAGDFVRINFACPRQTLLKGLDKLKKAIDQLM